MREKLEKIIDAYDELQAKMGDPAVLANQKEYNRLAKEYADQGQEYYEERYRQRVEVNLRRKAETLGLRLVPMEAA